MDVVNNERGISLIEAIAALTLLSIIFIAFASFFVQSAKFNTSNDANIQAANIVREYVAIYSNNNVDFDTKPWNYTPIGFTKDESHADKIIISGKKDGFTVEITVNKNKETGEFYRELRKVHVAVWKGNKVGKPLSESYTYHEGVVSSY